MKKIEIRRHALKGSGAMKDILSPEGIAQARKVGEGMKSKSFTHVVVSPFFRTAQTAAAMIEGAGDSTASKLTVSSALFTERFNEWVEYHKALGAVVVAENPLVRDEAPRMAADLKALLDSLPDGATVLAVGHTPFVECLILGLTGQVIAGLKECEGVELEVSDDGNVRLVAEIRG